MSEIITQRHLREYMQQRYHLRECRRKIDAVREALLQQIAAHATIEEGQMVAVVRTYTQLRPTWPNLTDILGEDEVEELRAMIAPTSYVNLIVSERKPPKALRRPKW